MIVSLYAMFYSISQETTHDYVVHVYEYIYIYIYLCVFSLYYIIYINYRFLYSPLSKPPWMVETL